MITSDPPIFVARMRLSTPWARSRGWPSCTLGFALQVRQTRAPSPGCTSPRGGRHIERFSVALAGKLRYRKALLPSQPQGNRP